MTKVQPSIETNKINRYVIKDCDVINYWQSFVRVGLKVFFKKNPPIIIDYQGIFLVSRLRFSLRSYHADI